MFHAGDLAALPENLLMGNDMSIKNDQQLIWCYGLSEALKCSKCRPTGCFPIKSEVAGGAASETVGARMTTIIRVHPAS